MPISRFILLLLLSGLLACQKPTEGIIPPTIPPVTIPQEQGVVYEKGTPQGQSVQKIIGPEGGTLVSADSTLLMTIPAGAVSQATGFSMQPVTPTLPGLIGKQSYRLLPEGLIFAKPVTLQFHYQEDELAGSSPQLLFMTYQGTDGIWKALPDTELDEATRTLTVNTTHFSDWGAFAEFELKVERDPIAPGESTNLTLTGYYELLAAPISDEQKEVALTQQTVLADSKNIKNWRVIGPGSIQAGTSQMLATYRSPSTITTNSALVSVEVYNFLPPNRRPRKGASGKAVLLKTIHLNEGNFFEATLDNQTFDCLAYGFVDDQGTAITATIGDISRPFYLRIRSKQLKASTTIAYDYLPLDMDGKAEVLLDDQGTDWVAYYNPCDGDNVVNSPGGVHIDTVEGRTVSGSLTVSLYTKEGCKVKSRKLTAKFKITLADA